MPINTQFFTDDWSSSSIEDLDVRAGKSWRIVYPAGSTRQIKTSGSVGTGAQATYPPIAGTAGTQTIYFGGAASVGADARVTVVIQRDGGGESGAIFLAARGTGTDAATANFYGVKIAVTLGGTTAAVTLFKVLSGGAITNITTASGPGSFAAANGTDVPVEFIVSGSTLTVNSGGVLIATATDTSIAAAGCAGVGAEKTNTAAGGGLTLRPSFVAYQTDAAPSPITMIAAWTEGSEVFAMAGSVAVSGVAVAAAWTEGAETISAAGTVTAATGTITTRILKNNTGFALVNQANCALNIYNATTGALVLRLTGLTTNSVGRLVVANALIVAGTTYAYEADLTAASLGRRLPTVAAA